MMFRSVVNWDWCGACRYTGYRNKSVRLVLSCGHELYRKASQGVPGKARCRECEREKAHLTFSEVQDLFDYAPHLNGVDSNEPTLRELLFRYYLVGLGSRQRAKECTNEYVDKLARVYGSEQ